MLSALICALYHCRSDQTSSAASTDAWKLSIVLIASFFGRQDQNDLTFWPTILQTAHNSINLTTIFDHIRLDGVQHRDRRKLACAIIQHLVIVNSSSSIFFNVIKKVRTNSLI
jgi:hypothetical protein